MKYEPSESRGEFHEIDAGESASHGSTGEPIKGKMTKAKKDYEKAKKEYETSGLPSGKAKMEKAKMVYEKAHKEFEAGKKKGMHKSGIETDDLQKSLDMLEGFATAEDAPTRKQELLSKAMESELSVEENAELVELMGGQPMQKSEPTVTDEIIEPMGSEPLNKAIDVSSFLSENHEALTKSLVVVGEAIEKSDRRRHDFSILLAKAVKDIGEMVKSNTETLAELAGQPVRGPKTQFQPGKPASAQQPAQALHKSFAGGDGSGNGEEPMSKSQTFDALDGLFEKSMGAGMEGRLPTGEDLSIEISKFEQTGMLSPNAVQAVREFYRSNQQAAH